MKTIISIVFCSLLVSCWGNTISDTTKEKPTQENEIKKKAEQLKKAHKKLLLFPYTVQYEEEYFEVFPKTFDLLNRLFGYSDKEPMGEITFESPLHNEAAEYIAAFLKLTGIEKRRFYNRIIDISLNGRWYADGVNYFKHGMEDRVKSDINLFSELLAKRNDKEIKSFWYFYFDNPHPIKKIPEKLQRVKEFDIRIFSLMELALKDVQQSWNGRD